MRTRIVVGIDVLDWDEERLRDTVHNIDAMHDPGHPIEPEDVRASDIMHALLSGELKAEHELVYEIIDENPLWTEQDSRANYGQ